MNLASPSIPPAAQPLCTPLATSHFFFRGKHPSCREAIGKTGKEPEKTQMWKTKEPPGKEGDFLTPGEETLRSVLIGWTYWER